MIRPTLVLLLLFIGLSTTTVIAEPAENQQQMNMRAQKDFETADADLNLTYKALVKGLSKETKDRLVDAQLAWIKYRDLNATAKAAEWEGGSMQPMIYAASRAVTTRRRTTELKEWLKDVGSR